MRDEPEFLSGIESSNRSEFFESLHAMLDDLDIDYQGLTDPQLEMAVGLFDIMFGSSSLAPKDRHEVLFRFAKVGGLPWLSRLAEIVAEVRASPGDWTSR